MQPLEPFALAATSASALAERTGVPQHDVMVVLGSGWGDAAEVVFEGGHALHEAQRLEDFQTARVHVSGFNQCAIGEGHVAEVVQGHGLVAPIGDLCEQGDAVGQVFAGDL